MVHKLFAWPHGGRRVFLSVSLNGWTEPVPMIVVEGSSTVFHKIIDLPPGYYQFKFLVDGVWRVDEQQLYVQDEYGIANNVVFVEELGPASPTVPAEAFRIGVDTTKIVKQAASSSGILHNEQVLHISDSEISVSRQHLAVHLSSYRTFELMPHSGKVFVLDGTVAVKQAFNIMHEKGLGVVPLWDDRLMQVTGMLTASDFILILVELNKNRSMLTDEQLQLHSVSAWKEEKLQLHRDACGTNVPLYRRPVIQVGPDESLIDMALRVLQNNISSVPVLYSADDGGCQHLLHIACLAGILRHICSFFRDRLEYLPLLQKPVGSLPLGTWTGKLVNANGCGGLKTLRPSDSLCSALKLLVDAQISSIPIIDEDGTLINVYSRSDITSLARGGVYAHIQLDQTNMCQALELADAAAPDRDRYKTCSRSDSLFRVMVLLSDPGVRRLIVTKPGSRHVEGIITLRDVFGFILL